MGQAPAGAVGVSRPEAAVLAEAALLLALATAPHTSDVDPTPPVSVTVTIPPGALTMTATRDGRQVVVTDTRAGELGYTISVTAERPARARVWAAGIPGNALTVDHLRLSDPVRLGRTPVAVATLPSGSTLGSLRLGVHLRGDVRVVWTVL